MEQPSQTKMPATSATHPKLLRDSRVFKSPVVKSFLAGAFGGTCSTIILQPLDLIKTRLQSAVAHDPMHGKGMVHNLVDVVKNERFFGLWKGVIPSLYRTVPGVGFYFCSLNWLQRQLGATDPSPIQALCCGVMARCLVGVALLPVTVVKVRFESKAYSYKSVMGALQSIYKLEGTKGLYSGLYATLYRDAPFSGLYFMFYTGIKKTVIDESAASSHSSVHQSIVFFNCAVLAGLLASITTQPADVIKTNMQLYPKKHTSMFSTLQFVLQENGVTGLFKGIVPRCIRRTLMAALAWTVYEEACIRLKLK